MLVVITIMIAAIVSFNRSHDSQVIPSKLVVNDSKVMIQLGTVGEKEGGLASAIQIESANVSALTIHVLEAKVIRGEERRGVTTATKTKTSLHAHTKDNTNSIGGENDDEVEDKEEEESTLKVDKVKSRTGTLLTFFISSHPPAHNKHKQRRGCEQQQQYVPGRLRLRIEVPIGFSGELTIDGSYLDIDGSNSLRHAQFNLLHLSTDEGNITLGSNSTDDDQEDDISTSTPTLQVAHLYARVNRKGSIRVGVLGSAEKGKAFRVNVETQQGDISIGAFQTMLDIDGGVPYPEDEEVVHYFNLVTHRGDIHMSLHEGDNLLGPWYIRGSVLVNAQAHGGSISGLVEFPDLQLLYLDAASDQETSLKVVSNTMRGFFFILSLFLPSCPPFFFVLSNLMCSPRNSPISL